MAKSTYTMQDVDDFNAKYADDMKDFFTQAHGNKDASSCWYNYLQGTGIVSRAQYLDDDTIMARLRGYRCISKVAKDEDLSGLALLVVLSSDAPVRLLSLPSEHGNVRILFQVRPPAYRTRENV